MRDFLIFHFASISYSINRAVFRIEILGLDGCDLELNDYMEIDLPFYSSFLAAGESVEMS